MLSQTEATAYQISFQKSVSHKQIESLLTQTSSYTSLKQIDIIKQELKGIKTENSKYSKLLKQKDLKIISLSQKLKSCQTQLDKYKGKSNGLDYDLNFFKTKLQQEFCRSFSLDDRIQIINKYLTNFIVRIVKILEKSDHSTKYFGTFLEMSKKNWGPKVEQFQMSKKLLGYLEFQINELVTTIQLFQKEQNQKNLMKSADLQIEKLNKSRENQNLMAEKYFDSLIDVQQQKIIIGKCLQVDRHCQKTERKFIINQLKSNDKQKTSVVTDIFQEARKQFKMNFQVISKQKITGLCLNLFSRLKDLEKQKKYFQNKTVISLSSQANKYQQVLKAVKKIRIHPSKQIKQTLGKSFQ